MGDLKFITCGEEIIPVLNFKESYFAVNTLHRSCRDQFPSTVAAEVNALITNYSNDGSAVYHLQAQKLTGCARRVLELHICREAYYDVTR